MKKILLLLTIFMGRLSILHTKIVLSPLFSDNMVLQQDTDAPIWGTAAPGKRVTISCSWAKGIVSTQADAEGQWRAIIRTPKAGGPHTITVSDGKKLVLSNVMTGEVWLCSGQSNMEYPVKGWTSVLNADEELAHSNHPNIRLLQIHKVASVEPNCNVLANSETWQTCAPTTLPEFSAIAYFFARKIRERLGDIPVGVIDATWGGSNIESWISAETLAEVPEFRDSIARTDYVPWRNSQTALYNGMIHPLVPMALRGVLWYQGEQNELRGWQYRDLFTLLIRDWRQQWKRELPFYYVQLANFHERHAEPVEALWAELREAQTMALHLPGTGMASAIDIGLGHDVHYPNKQEVARRLALIALAKTYGQPIEYSGPQYKDYTIVDHKVTVCFTHADGLTFVGGDLESPTIALRISNSQQPITGFCIAGSDHVWHHAQVRIVSQGKVEVWSEEVRYPIHVRYLWQDNPEATLYNAAGLPANPFRTDDWPLLSQGKTRSNSDY